MKFLRTAKSLVCAILFCVSSSRVSPKQTKELEAQSNEAKVLEDLPNSSQFSCAASCKLSPRCQTVSFDKKTLRCLLLDGRVETPAGDDGKAGNPILISHVTEWPDSISGPCCATSTTCPDRTVCLVDRLNRPSCSAQLQSKKLTSKAVTECGGNFTLTENGCVRYLDIQLKNPSVYKCRPESSSASSAAGCKATGVAECRNGGVWTENKYKITLDYFTLTTSDVDFTLKIPCPLCVGASVEVVGETRGDASSRSHLKLSLQKSSLVLMSMLVMVHNRELTVSFLTIGPGIPTDNESAFGELPGGEFNFTIVAEAECYEIRLNGKVLHRFRHRAPFGLVRDLLIVSRLKLSQVRIGYPK